MRYPQLASKKECTGCLACIDACPTSSLKKNINEEGHFFYELDYESCIKCNKCEKVCPVIMRTNYSLSGYGDFYAVWAVNENLRKSSASGGAFAAIAKYVLDKKGVVFGAANMDICNISHICIEHEDELYKLQGSKYTASDATGSYERVYTFLKQGRTVLFSGTGCQVAGLKTFLNKKHYEGNLLTVDLICGGVPSRFLIEKFIDNEPYKVKKILSFRTKDSGWKSTGFLYNMKVMDVNNQIHNYKGKRNLITDGFCSELTNRYSCYKCKFNGGHRISDFTVGDLWGDRLYVEEHYDGLSLLIAHSNQAIELLSSLRGYLNINPYDREEAIKYNPRIINGRSYKRYMPERIYMAYLFKHLSYDTLKKIYAYDFGKQSIWMVYKVYRYLINKLFG